MILCDFQNTMVEPRTTTAVVVVERWYLDHCSITVMAWMYHGFCTMVGLQLSAYVHYQGCMGRNNHDCRLPWYDNDSTMVRFKHGSGSMVVPL